MVAFYSVGFIFIILAFTWIFLEFRNNWVYTKRIWIIDNKWPQYEDYLTYHQMFLRFWIWDIEKLKKPKQDIYEIIRQQVKEAKKNGK